MIDRQKAINSVALATATLFYGVRAGWFGTRVVVVDRQTIYYKRHLLFDKLVEWPSGQNVNSFRPIRF